MSVGNRAIGGAGKTPTVIALAQLLIERGFRVAILTRGYQREGAADHEIVDSSDAARFGDEPVVIATALPGVPVIVGADRHASGTWFLSRDDCDLFLLDDGFQHLQLARDCDVVIESQAKLYREGPSALRDADLVLRREEELRLTTRALRLNGESRSIEALRDMRVVAFSALADNDQFIETLRRHGANVVEMQGRTDHHRWSAAEVATILRRAKELGATPVTTEKDAVKIGESAAVLEVAMELRDPEKVIGDILRLCGLRPR